MSQSNLDELATTNRARWNNLVDANIEYSRPLLELTPASARAFLDPHGVMGEVAGKEVLCLAGGGGQQSAAFALLGAQVTVLDLADKQLARDRQAAEHYGFTIRTIQGDMRELHHFADASFDLVYHAFSINFVPSVAPVFAEVARICRPHARYRLEWHNPFTQLVEYEGWDGKAYPMRHEYSDGREATELYPNWTVEDADGNAREIAGPREFVHTLSSVINTLVANGFVIYHAAEYLGDSRAAEAGSWQHFMQVIAPYLTLWSRYAPGALA
jgi:SAM-dependent methyltransferase